MVWASHSYVVAALFTLLLGAWLATRRNSVKLPDTSTLGCLREKKIAGSAVVCGGSISGILAARVCADHFEEVVLVDPEFNKALNGGAKTRIMQWKSTHFFLFAAIIGLRKLWPDIDQHILNAGGIITDANFKHRVNGEARLPSWKPGQPFPRVMTYLIRRVTVEPILEKLLVETCPNLRIVDGVVRQISLSAPKVVQSVTVRDLDGKTFELRDPDLVIDCTGTTQAGVKWLKAAGIDVPDTLVSKYHPHLNYLSITFSPSPDVQASLPIPGGFENSPFIYAYNSTPEHRENVNFIFNRFEKNLAGIVFGGRAGNLPRTPEEVKEFLVKLKFLPEWVIETIRILLDTSNPSMEAVTLPNCSWTHFEKMRDIPSNFVVLGDAALKANPIYGQGMAKSMLSVTVLDGLLSKCTQKEDVHAQFSLKYHQGIASTNAEIWNLTRLNDYAYDTTDSSEGETLSNGTFFRWFGRNIIWACMKDPEVAVRFGLVEHLLEPASFLLTPSVLTAVLKEVICRREW